MSEIDPTILDYMHDIGREHDFRVVQPPATVWQNLYEELEVIDRSSSTVRRRLKILVEKGLLEKVDAKGTYYRITDDGVRYVEGNMGRDELEDLGMEPIDSCDEQDDDVD